jgi:hypothetical protein
MTKQTIGPCALPQAPEDQAMTNRSDAATLPHSVPIAAGWNEINGRAAAVAALWAAWDYFQDRADADCDGDPPRFRPNREMSLQTECEAALRALGESVP